MFGQREKHSRLTDPLDCTQGEKQATALRYSRWRVAQSEPDFSAVGVGLTPAIGALASRALGALGAGATADAAIR